MHRVEECPLQPAPDARSTLAGQDGKRDVMDESDAIPTWRVLEQGFDSARESVLRGEMDARVEHIEDVVGGEREGFDEVVDLGVWAERDVA